ncbi:LysR family transcriptional regulator [Streptomyces sp. L-9-10]|uniref:LysR family transcriptional regulator n=1 Tax=Streptomyces sp. L-9-10 TaxID=1478131 RepID=UPI0010EE49B4|nr:LysR family transcriptional regulator [Streptomyces sp. L-9-10]RYJ27496.1 LysR family transcriptional regulator [Streptomyces sp. L-9-10]
MDLLRHLRIFAVVAEELHFSRAADILGMAQPPLSQAIRRLEKELGTELFDRSRRQVRLTAAGTVLLEEARDLLVREERLRALVCRAGEGGPSALRAGVPPDTPASVLHALLAACAERAPDLRVDLREETTEEQLRLLASGRLDVGLLHQPADITGLVAGPEVSMELGVVLPRTSPLAGAPEVALGELAGHDLVLFPRATAPGRYDSTLDSCRLGGFVPARIQHARTPEFLIGLVAAGQGIAFDAGPVARKEPRVVWRPLAGRPLTQRIVAVRPTRATHPAARTFAELATDVLARDSPSAVRPARESGEPGGYGKPGALWSPGEEPPGDQRALRDARDPRDPRDPQDPTDPQDRPGPRPWSVVYG